MLPSCLQLARRASCCWPSMLSRLPFSKAYRSITLQPRSSRSTDRCRSSSAMPERSASFRRASGLMAPTLSSPGLHHAFLLQTGKAPASSGPEHMRRMCSLADSPATPQARSGRPKRSRAEAAKPAAKCDGRAELPAPRLQAASCRTPAGPQGLHSAGPTDTPKLLQAPSQANGRARSEAKEPRLATKAVAVPRPSRKPRHRAQQLGCPAAKLLARDLVPPSAASTPGPEQAQEQAFRGATRRRQAVRRRAVLLVRSATAGRFLVAAPAWPLSCGDS
mmetsp:Transcript_41576/g.115682  ORF Transcript_41576/g.115682 Transcript_41576/m.115682 type:complete len:277 (+) Transcript_41576:682-1512(+)